MKNTIKSIAIATIALVCGNSAFAQSSATDATAQAGATIITPIAITRVHHLQFGGVVASSTPGTVELAASSAAARTPGGGVTLPTGVAGSPTAASYTVTGESGATYTITIPLTAAVTTVSDGASHTMDVDTWTNNFGATSTIGTGTLATLYVGATLHVGGSQAPGVYSSASSGGTGPFSVTVNY